MKSNSIMLYFSITRPIICHLVRNVTKRNICSISQCNELIFKSNARLNYPLNFNRTSTYLCVRYFAKGKDIKKEKGKKKVEINETQLAEIIKLESLQSHMQKAVDILKDEYFKNLSLRSTTGSIETLLVNVDEKDYTLQELAQIVRKNPNTLIINMSTFPQAIPAVLKSLAKSGMNLNPQQDGTTLYIPIPKVTKEHREHLAKSAKTLFTKCKDHIRDTQNKFTKNVKKQENLSTDLVHSVQEQIINIGDKYILEAEKILISKQHELLGKD